MQIDSSNSIAHYYRGLIYYMVKNFSNAMVAFEKCIELDPNNNLAKMQLYYLNLLDNNDFRDLNNIIIKLNQIDNINDDRSLLFMRCKIYIKLKKYNEALLDLDGLFELDNDDISFTYLLKGYSDFWLHLCNNYTINVNGLTEFSCYMYEVEKVYLISNLINLDSKLGQFIENDLNSLSKQVVSFKDEVTPISLPKLFVHSCYITWKMNIKKVLSKDCLMKIIVAKGIYSQLPETQEHILKYEDVLKLEGLGWIEYTLPFLINLYYEWIQPSIDLKNNTIIMQIDYVRIVPKRERIYFPKMGHSLPIHKVYPNVPEAFKDKYFSKKEMENLIELNDIINN